MADMKALRQRIINELCLSPTYQDLIRALREQRPSIPYWDTGTDNTAKLQEASAQQRHHDYLMAIIEPKEIK